MPVLSIITPFYNSEKKCERLLSTLSNIETSEVELIFINDGSTDSTAKLLKEFNSASNIKATILSQQNKGPGAARNAGFSICTGKYVWFVDSDDDIHLNAVEFILKNSEKNYDLIDFNMKSKRGTINSMSLKEGYHSDFLTIRKTTLENFGRICTKCINRQLITKYNIFYPEYCIYEDNALSFIYPFAIKNLYKSDIVGYVHHEDFPSITRKAFGSQFSLPSPRYFDRMRTALWGLNRGMQVADKSEVHHLKDKFIKLYLFNTLSKLFTQIPSPRWILACRVMRQYRTDTQKLGLSFRTFDYKSKNFRFKLLFPILWVLSYLLPDQSVYFDRIQYLGWKRSPCESRES